MQSILRLRVAGPRVTAPARRQFTASTLRLAGGPGFKDGDSATSSSDATASKAIPKTNTDTSGKGSSVGDTHAKDGGEDSVVPKAAQKAVPESVERALPDAIHNTGDSKK